VRWCGRGPRLWITPRSQLDAAAAGVELVELELEPFDDDFSEDDFSEDDFSVDAELVDSEPAEPLDDELDELVAELLAASRLSLR
jgi:hypothetical protein